MNPFHLACLFLAAFGLLFSPLAAAKDYSGHVDIDFRGKSNLHGFSGQVTKVPLLVKVEGDGSGQELLSMQTQVTVRDLTTKHRKRDRDMWKMFGYADHPLITVRVRNASLAQAYPKGSRPGTLPVTMIIQGKETPVPATTHNLKESSTGGSFELRMTLSLQKLGLKAPQTFLLKVDDTVEVVGQVTLNQR